MASLSPDEQAYVAGVSAATGLDPRVLVTWIQSEGAPGNAYHNYMNIQTPTAQSLGIPVVGTAAADTAEFGDVQTGIRAAVAEINSLGINAAASPRQELSNIAHTGWASSHYSPLYNPTTNPHGLPESSWGGNLYNVFSSIFGASALDSPAQKATGPAGVAITGNFPTQAGTAIQGVKGAVTGAESGIQSGFRFLTSWRFAEIVGGFLLLLVGVVLLARQFGVAVPGPRLPIGGGSLGDAPISEQPRRVQRRAGFEPQSAERDRREARRPGGPRSDRLAPGDSIPY